jgi:flagellar biosynthesis protein FlhF
MELKKFEAPTLAEALQVVKRELGPEAVILSTKNIRSGWGLMNRASVEVTAAVHPEALERKRLAEESMSAEQQDTVNRGSAAKAAQAYDVFSGNRLKRQMARVQEYGVKASTTATARTTAAPAANLQAAIAKLAAKAAAPQNYENNPITQRRYADIQDDETPAEQMSSHSRDRMEFSMRPDGNAYPPAQQPNAAGDLFPKLIAKLIDQGIDQDIVKGLADELKMVMIREHIVREDLLRLQLGRILMSRIRVAKPLSERLRRPNTPRVITFVGPTGVGKTTTIAKIAAELVINQKRPVTLATTDTYKIAAVEQLQTYANILRIPLEVCPNAESFAALGTNLGPDDVILVDTAGYGPRDNDKLDELKSILSGVRTEIHLCLAATTRDQDVVGQLKRFGLFAPDYVVLTKLDETGIFGSIVNVAARTSIPLSYFTMGQRVPEDMETASKERVADLILHFAGGDSAWIKQIG